MKTISIGWRKPVFFSVCLFLSFLATPLQSAPEDKIITKTKVETLRLIPRGLKNYSVYVGRLIPLKRVKVSSEVAGTVKKIPVYVGQKITKGQTIAELDKESRLLNNSLNKSNYELALLEYEREKRLFAKKLSTSAKVSSLKNRMVVNKMLWSLSTLDLKKSEIKSPLNGLIKHKLVEEGNFVKLGNVLMEIVDISKTLVVVNIPEGEIVKLQKGQSVEVSLDSFPGKIWQGVIKTIQPEANYLSRNFPVEIEIDNHEGMLLPGLSARVKIETLNLENQILIPRHTILEEEKGGFVYIVRQNKAVKVSVKTGVSPNNEVRILSGLKSGDNLIVVGHQFVANQETVQIIKSVEQLP